MIVNIFAWMQIIASPVLLAFLISAIIYIPNPTNERMYISIGLIAFALILGILYANKIWKAKGTMAFLSQISATPDIDEALDKTEKKNQAEKENC